MFEGLTSNLNKVIQNIRGQGRLTEENIQDALRQVRMALLEADVALVVVREFIKKVKERAIGQEVLESLTPGQAFIKIVHDALVEVMGKENQALSLNAQPPVVVLMAGLQGAGKTTTTGKLALYLKEKEKKKVMVVSADVYRPAAIKQLETLAKSVDIAFFPSDTGQKPVDIVKQALHAAKTQHMEVLLVDTAGRLHIDEEMMNEVKSVHAAIDPHETLFVVDSMTGQDAANTAKAFDEALPLTGVVLTKTDGDARGGAALSIRHITGKPIKFLGAGEKVQALQPFYPDRLASRILDMGDIVSLVEEVQDKIDQKEAEKLAKKMKKGKGFDLEDLRMQFLQMEKMGGMENLIDKIPGAQQAMKKQKNLNLDNAGKEIKRSIAIINSMTMEERRKPEIIKASRKRRIARGAGLQVQDVNKLMKQHKDMSAMMKKMSKGGMEKMMSQFGGKMPF